MNHPQHTYTGLGGLRVTTKGNDFQTEYRLREPGVQNVDQQAQPLANAGSNREEQNPLKQRTKARKWSKQDEQLQAAIDEDLSKRGVSPKRKTKTTETTTDKTEQ